MRRSTAGSRRPVPRPSRGNRVDEKAYKAALDRIPDPRRSMIHGASRGPRIPQRSPNRKSPGLNANSAIRLEPPPGIPRPIDGPGGRLMFRRVLHTMVLTAGILSGTQAAFAENRVALVIGQSNYRAVVALPNPANDAKAVSQLLTRSRFRGAHRRRSVAERDARKDQRLRSASGGQRPRYHRAGVLCRSWPADRWREFSGAGGCRSEARGRHSAAGACASTIS